MATIKDVARLAGVSVATVSRVINNSPKASEASRLAVHSAMESLSYHPNANARALAQQTTETVGLVVGDVSDPFFGAMVKAVEQVAYHTGNFLLIGNGYHNEQKERQAIEQLIRHRCAALVVHAKMIPDADLASLMKQMPGMVLINRILPGFENRCIALDDRYGAWLATRIPSRSRTGRSAARYSGTMSIFSSQMYCQISCSVQLESGKTRMLSPLLICPL